MELLVALAVSSIVLVGVSYLIFTSLRLYGTGNANVEIQNESQTVLNLVLDNVMEATGVCMIVPDSGNTDLILLGDFVVYEYDDKYRAVFVGTALAYMEAVNEMYLIDVAEAGLPLLGGGANYANYCLLVDGCASKEEAASEGLARVHDFIFGVGGMDAAARLPWLMGQFVSSCRIVPANTADFIEKKQEYLNGTTEFQYYYTEPFTLQVNLGFDLVYNNKHVTRRLEDDVAVRSRMKSIYIDIEDKGWGMKEYKHQ